jgi:O-antigen ligase
VVWTVVIALDFFWFANPRVLVSSFDRSLLIACVVTTVGAAITFSSLRVPRPAESVLAFLALAFASVLWSINADQTFAFTMRYVLIAAVATVIAWNADARAIVHGLTLSGVLFLAVSVYVIEQEMPGSRGPAIASYTFAGVGGNRNILAYTLVLAFAFAVSLVPRSTWVRLAWAIAVGALMVGVFLAKSATGLMAVTLVTVAAVVLHVMDRRRLEGRPVDRRRLRLAWVIAAAGVIATVVGGALFGELLGRNVSTLSGRTQIWEAIWQTTTGVDRWIGSGWGAVWRHPWLPAPMTPEGREIIDQTGYMQWHGHNWAFDLLPELGLLGVAVFATLYLQAGVRATRQRSYRIAVTDARLQASRAALLGLLALLLIGLTEPMSTIPLGWFATVLLATGLAVPRARGEVAMTGPRREPPREPTPTPDPASEQQ